MTAEEILFKAYKKGGKDLWKKVLNEANQIRQNNAYMDTNELYYKAYYNIKKINNENK